MLSKSLGDYSALFDMAVIVLYHFRGWVRHVTPPARTYRPRYKPPHHFFFGNLVLSTLFLCNHSDLSAFNITRS